jgi:hypothetical protein
MSMPIAHRVRRLLTRHGYGLGQGWFGDRLGSGAEKPSISAAGPGGPGGPPLTVASIAERTEHPVHHKRRKRFRLHPPDRPDRPDQSREPQGIQMVR